MKKNIFLTAFVLFASLVFSHECFIFAHKFVVVQGDDLELHLFIADGLNIQQEKAFKKSVTHKFDLINENGTKDLLQTTNEGQLPVANIKVDFKGQGLLVMERNAVEITLSNQKFAEYIKEDHVENIKINFTKTSQKETYTRYIKSLVQSNFKPSDSLFKARVGAKFEIVLLQNPYLLKIGERLQAQIFFNGKPLPNKVITARNRLGAEPANSQTARTDASGICQFTVKRRGDWLLHVTHMVPCADPKTADWESFWATFTFGI